MTSLIRNFSFKRTRKEVNKATNEVFNSASEKKNISREIDQILTSFWTYQLSH